MQKVYIGVDVSSEDFWLYFCLADQAGQVRKFANQSSGFEQALAWVTSCLGDLEGAAHWVIEATGIYHSRLSVYLHKAGQTISVVNPLQVKHFGKMNLWRSKTDRKDAELISKFGECLRPSVWEPPRASMVKIRQAFGNREFFVKERTRLTNRIHALEKEGSADQECLAQLIGHLESVSAQIKDCEKRLEKLVRAEDAELLDHLCSIPGIGPKTAWLLVLVSQKFEKFENVKSLIAYVGLAPRTFESGSSVRGKAHICKMGSAWLRRTIFMAATAAIRYNKACRLLYERLRQKGKPHHVAKIAVANKLIRQAFAVAKSGRAYDEDLALGKIKFG